MPKSDAAIDRLIDASSKLWLDLEMEVVNNLVDSMPNRVRATIEAKGWYTKYKK